MRAVLVRLPVAMVLGIACLLLGTGLGNATGTGYDLSYAQGPPIPIKDVALIGLDSQDPGGSNLTISLTVAGVFVLDNSSYAYRVLFFQAASWNSSLQVAFSNNSTGSYEGSVNGPPVSGAIPFSLQDQGSVLTFSIAKAILPAAGGFGLAAFANATIGTSLAISQLGATGNGGSCSGPACDPQGGGGSGGGSFVALPHLSEHEWIAVGAAGALAVVALGVVVLRQRREKVPPPPGGPAT